VNLQRVLDHDIKQSDADDLGHMRVGRYAEVAEGACGPLLATVGANTAWLEDHGCISLTLDAYTRQHREQFVGGALSLTGGFLEPDGGDLTVYIEMRNRDTGDLAAASTQRVRMFGLVDRVPIPFPESVLDSSRLQAVEWPAAGRPRTLQLAPITVPTMDDLYRSTLELWHEGQIGPDDCDATGWYSAGLTKLAWGPHREFQELEPHLKPSWLFSGPHGERLGLANMESRRVLLDHPRVGTPIRTVAANIEIGRNYRVRREWTFDPSSGRMYAAGDFVDLLFDTEARRAVSISTEARVELELRLNPNFR
jgi:acyl-CoA thioesterase FadM